MGVRLHPALSLLATMTWNNTIQEKTIRKRISQITGIAKRRIFVHRTAYKDRREWDFIINPQILFIYPITSLPPETINNLCAYIDTVRAQDTAHIGVYYAPENRWDILITVGDYGH